MEMRLAVAKCENDTLAFFVFTVNPYISETMMLSPYVSTLVTHFNALAPSPSSFFFLIISLYRTHATYWSGMILFGVGFKRFYVTDIS